MKIFIGIALLASFSLAHASLADDLAPLLALLGPTLDGLDAGLQDGAGNIKAAVQNLGATLAQLANGVGIIAGNTVNGLGETTAELPGALHQAVSNVDKSPGLVGTVDRTLLGGKKGK